MGYWSAFCLRLFLSTKIRVKGYENLINNEKFSLKISHQSMFETFIYKLFLILLFLFLKRITFNSYFGWYLKN